MEAIELICKDYFQTLGECCVKALTAEKCQGAAIFEGFEKNEIKKMKGLAYAHPAMEKPIEDEAALEIIKSFGRDPAQAAENWNRYFGILFSLYTDQVNL
jgi:hypothetical protein